MAGQNDNNENKKRFKWGSFFKDAIVFGCIGAVLFFAGVLSGWVIPALIGIFTISQGKNVKYAFDKVMGKLLGGKNKSSDLNDFNNYAINDQYKNNSQTYSQTNPVKNENEIATYTKPGEKNQNSQNNDSHTFESNKNNDVKIKENAKIRKKISLNELKKGNSKNQENKSSTPLIKRTKSSDFTKTFNAMNSFKK